MRNDRSDKKENPIKQRTVLLLLAASVFVCALICVLFWLDEMNNPMPTRTSLVGETLSSDESACAEG